MVKRKPRVLAMPQGLEKCPTGIRGLDEITHGGLPKGRPTLICGGAGSGKTLIGVEFLVHGAIDYNEPGVFMAFEEAQDELSRNVASLNIDLRRLMARKKLVMDSVRIDPAEIEETGAYDLSGLFIRLGEAIDSVGAKRVVLDTIEVLFSGLENHAILRSELRRLFRWLKEKGVTAIVTGERGDKELTRHGLEEYVADCVIVLDHRILEQISTRRLRIVKYRGSTHGTNEYPFLITKSGVSVLPVTSLDLKHVIGTKRVTSGIPRLDTLLGGDGYYTGSSILISGSAGSGKTSMAAAFAAAICRRGERCLYLAFEEAETQILRNMKSVGFDLEPFVKKGLLQFHCSRPTALGLEAHLFNIHELVMAFNPAAVIVDPVSNLTNVGTMQDVRATLARIIDFLKERRITLLCTSLVRADEGEDQSEIGISSLMDTWILVRNLENNGERNRGLYILKSRGMAHSNQIREFRLTSKGIELLDVYIGSGTVLTGSARVAQEERERVEGTLYQHEIEARRAEIQHRQASATAQIESSRAELTAANQELKRLDAAATLRKQDVSKGRTEMARLRMADANPAHGDGHAG